MFYQIKNPPQWMLDNLLNEDKAEKCPDCQASSGEPHSAGCDTAHCLKTGIQRIQCDCGECGEDVWDGHWPGMRVAYERKYVCYDTATQSVMLDLNPAAIVTQMQKRGCSEEEIVQAVEEYWDKG